MKRIAIPLLHALIMLCIYVLVLWLHVQMANINHFYNQYISRNMLIKFLIVDCMAFLFIYLYIVIRGIWNGSPHSNIWEEARFRRLDSKMFVFSVWVGLGCGLIFISMISMPLLDSFFFTQHQSVRQLVQSNHWIWLVLALCIISPLFEETLFRGFIFNELKKGLPVWQALAVQAWMYAYCQPGLHTPWIAFAVALALAAIYHMTGSIWCNMIVSATHNLTILSAQKLNLPTLLPFWGNVSLVIVCMFWLFWIAIGMIALHYCRSVTLEGNKYRTLV